jgi:hypothetical protein
MSLEPIRTEVRWLLALTNEEIREAEWTRAHDSGVARVRAAGELVHLRRHQAALRDRMHELDAWRDDAASTVVQWFRENWMILMYRMQSWIER